MRLGYRMRVDLRSRTEVFAYYTGRYDTHLIAAATRMLPLGGVVLDLGGNIGFWSIPMAKRGVVHAYEPVPGNAERLRENAQLNGVAHRLAVHEVALSDSVGEVQITLREDFARGAGTGNAAIVIDSTDARFQTLTIPTSTLDAEVARLGLASIDIVKLDVEGHEDLCLRGGRQALERFRPLMFVEWNRSYYDRRQVDPTARFHKELAGLEYAYLRQGAQGWEQVEGFFSPRELDDLVLAPATTLPDVLAALG